MARLVPKASRSSLGRLLAAIAAALLVLVAPASAAGPGVDAVEADLLARINAVRAGEPALRSHAQLAAAAHEQAAWLAGLTAAERDALTAETGHCGGPGCPELRAAAAGWPDARTILAEILHLGGREPGTSPQQANDAVIAAWRASPVHDRHLRAPGWATAGIAIVGDVTVVVFAQPCTVATCVEPGGTGGLLPAGATGADAERAAPAGLGADAGTASPGRAGAAGRAESGGTAAGSQAARGSRACAPTGNVRVLLRGRRRVGLEVRMSCRRPGRRYRVRVRDGRRKRTVALRRTRAVVAVRASRRARWVRVSVDEDRRPLGTVRVRVRGR